MTQETYTPNENPNPGPAQPAGFQQEPFPPIPPIPPVPPIPQPVKIRRVGTATLGLTLILIGVLIPTMMFFPEYALPIIRMGPLVLLTLGVEILFYALTWKQGKLKYDGLSIFMAIMITLCSLTASAVLPFVQRGTQYNKLEQQKSGELQRSLREVLDELDYSGNISVRVYPAYGSSYWDSLIHPEDRLLEDWEYSVSIDLRRVGSSGLTPEKAADVMLAMLREMESIDGLEQVYIALDTDPDGDSYTLNESRAIFQHLNRKDLLERIEVTTYQQRNAIYTQEEYEEQYQAGFEAGRADFANSEEANRNLENAYNEGYQAGRSQGVDLEEHNRLMAEAYAEGYEAGRNESL